MCREDEQMLNDYLKQINVSNIVVACVTADYTAPIQHPKGPSSQYRCAPMIWHCPGSRVWQQCTACSPTTAGAICITGNHTCTWHSTGRQLTAKSHLCIQPHCSYAFTAFTTSSTNSNSIQNSYFALADFNIKFWPKTAYISSSGKTRWKGQILR